MSRKKLIGMTSVFLVAAASSAYALQRDLLWLAVKACGAMSEVIGSYPPCFRVEARGNENAAHVILRPTTSPTHFVLAPLAKVVGVEDQVLQGASGGAIWMAAWSARRHVAEASRGVGLNAIGVAANAKGARSQDQLHIHIDCIKPRVLSRLPLVAKIPPGVWSSSSVTLEQNPFFIMPVVAVATLNPFVELQKLPGHMHGASIAGLPDGRGGLFLLALKDPQRGSEELLDHACELSNRGGAQTEDERKIDG